MSLVAPVLIFVRPQAAGNIGALTRVMSNFACTELRLVGTSPVYGNDPNDPFSRMDWAMAKKGEQILWAARWYPTLNDALHGLHLVVGSSGRSGEFERGYARPLVKPEAAFASVAKAQEITGRDAFRWGFVLGPEDDGLSDFEAALCQTLIRIPTVDESPSINIAMAAGCVLYHWHMRNELTATVDSLPSPFVMGEAGRRFTERGRGDWATHEHKEDFLRYLLETISQTQFLKYPDVEAVTARIRRWLQSAPIPLGELLFAFEIIYHLRAKITGRFEERNFLKSRSDFARSGATMSNGSQADTNF